mmetsp:Transcript_25015/g.37146  ORF Transcript_25015/g.37146 Transcript_25015/m.37146 type:complete len:336 (-) Transcript_25015:1405-2412(-)
MNFLLACIALTALQSNNHSVVHAFTVSSSHRRTITIKPQSLAPKSPLITLQPPPSSSPSTTTLYGLFDDDDSDSQIPPELQDEIYAAEANTPAAQGRQARVITYIWLTIVGVTTAFFNAFLSDLRFGDGSPSSDLAYYGFEWVQSNPLTGFLFTNKIGGALGLLGAGLSGTLAEVELRSKKENAEKIWEELQRRKEAKERPTKSNKKKKKSRSQSSKKDMTGKQKKRMSALEELMVDDEPVAVEVPPVVEATTESQEKEVDQTATSSTEEGEGGIFGKIKGFYEKADSMAASQALLLNKELEDRGVIDKITDESGLKVVGKEAAAKLKENKTEDD